MLGAGDRFLKETFETVMTWSSRDRNRSCLLVAHASRCRITRSGSIMRATRITRVPWGRRARRSPERRGERDPRRSRIEQADATAVSDEKIQKPSGCWAAESRLCRSVDFSRSCSPLFAINW